ncbi:hypothetical protein KPL47_08985 [Clostridium estertheticum]|uniref:hypothetical protein n=1 Tax=Clostridium estertheticum TaxID=238834 RepID=UPI001C0DCAD1|nr:hypothetical protein [Clostridium estertheticum]MBU3176507.1 hypothetical protein [Clostridium estertheticum]
MTAYELLDFYVEVLDKINELSPYTKELTNLSINIKLNQDKLVNIIYSDDFATNNGNIMNPFNAHKKGVITCMQNFLMEFDILKNHEKLVKVRNEIKYIFEKYPIISEDERLTITKLLDDYDKVTNTIYKYVKTRNNSIIVELLNEVSLTVIEFNSIAESYKNIKKFMLKTENKIDEKEEEKILELHFYDGYIDPQYFVLNIQSINKSYEVMCQIMSISLMDYPLKVVKIESGCFLSKLLGYKSVVDALAFLIKKITELMFNKFTFEGQVLRRKQILDLVKEDLEIQKKYKELGYEIDFGNEDIIKYHYQMVKSIGELIGKTTKIKINDEMHYLENNLKKKYLMESSVLLIEDSKEEKKLEQTTEKGD